MEHGRFDSEEKCEDDHILMLLWHTLRCLLLVIVSFSAHGIDTRVRGIKLSCLEERSLGFDQDFFSGTRLVRYPLLQSYSPSAIYRRSIVLQRYVLASLLTLLVCCVKVMPGNMRDVMPNI